VFLNASEAFIAARDDGAPNKKRLSICGQTKGSQNKQIFVQSQINRRRR